MQADERHFKVFILNIIRKGREMRVKTKTIFMNGKKLST